MSVTNLAMIDAPALTFFAMTPGELLERVLEERTLEKTEFARRVGRSYLTINRWTKNEYFSPKNQRLAAAELGLEADYFSRPMSDEAARAREAYRRRVFAEFLDNDVGRRLAASHPDIVNALNSTPIPAGRRPSVDFYIGMSLVFTRSLDPEIAAEAIELNEQLSASVAAKTAKPVGRRGKTARRPRL